MNLLTRSTHPEPVIVRITHVYPGPSSVIVVFLDAEGVTRSALDEARRHEITYDRRARLAQDNGTSEPLLRSANKPERAIVRLPLEELTTPDALLTVAVAHSVIAASSAFLSTTTIFLAPTEPEQSPALAASLWRLRQSDCPLTRLSLVTFGDAVTAQRIRVAYSALAQVQPDTINTRNFTKRAQRLGL